MARDRRTVDLVDSLVCCSSFICVYEKREREKEIDRVNKMDEIGISMQTCFMLTADFTDQAIRSGINVLMSYKFKINIERCAVVLTSEQVTDTKIK